MTWPIALVTGASSGIGRSIALELARRGHDLLVVGRDEASLGTACSEHRREGVKSEYAIVDLADRQAVGVFAESLRERPVGILVNNAGFGVFGKFAETDLADDLRLVEVQLCATFAITKACVPGMIERGRGSILNVASLYSEMPVPNQAVYGATKAALASFSDALAAEVGPRGVHVTVGMPGVTRTRFRTRQGLEDGSGRFVMDADKVARDLVTATLAGRRRSVPGIANAFAIAGARTLPRGFVPEIVRAINRRRGVGDGR
jgi:short-subunit dehydrogenase